jgi:adenosylcobinamide kinase/adenosylcobinamide-phosphate guanylyltransferase
MSKSILIIGGARSGKSYFAQQLALKSAQPVLFVATAEAGDEEMRQRIEEHRKARPATWNTLEVATHVGNNLRQKISKAQTVIVDCITLLVNNVFNQYCDPADEQIDVSLIEQKVMVEINELVGCIKQSDASFIIVTNEIGLGLVPANRMSRLYRDLIGKINQMLAHTADEVYLMSAGIPLLVKPARPL